MRGHVHPAEHVQRVLAGRRATGASADGGSSRACQRGRALAGVAASARRTRLGVGPQRGRVGGLPGVPGPLGRLGDPGQRGSPPPAPAAAPRSPGWPGRAATRWPTRRPGSRSGRPAVPARPPGPAAASPAARRQRRRRVSDRTRRGVTSSTQGQRDHDEQPDGPECRALGALPPARGPPRCSSLASGPVCAPRGAGLRWPSAGGSRLGCDPPGRGAAPAAACRPAGLAVAWPPVPAGVGSKRSQPTPWKYSSGQACASLVLHLPAVVARAACPRCSPPRPGTGCRAAGPARPWRTRTAGSTRALVVVRNRISASGRAGSLDVQAVGELAGVGEPALQGHRLTVGRALRRG